MYTINFPSPVQDMAGVPHCSLCNEKDEPKVAEKSNRSYSRHNDDDDACNPCSNFRYKATPN